MNNSKLLNCTLHDTPLKHNKYQPSQDDSYSCVECNRENDCKELRLERAFQDFLKKRFSYLVLFPFFYTFISILLEFISLKVNFSDEISLLVKLPLSITLVFLFKKYIFNDRTKKLNECIIPRLKL
ncbi:hypothetical protein [Acinetobacter johnsonii]|uniref:hypothetical protein n=1 Tax=Acinetobacter johnsonii TaxID=40214 RepID=UPI0012BAF7C8|nr:hypothetical protein [Acinetobacter johnsonii]